jgi:hypothetical protein
MTEGRFNPREHLRMLRGKGGESEYLEVKWRLVWLRAEHPDAQIATQLHAGGVEEGHAVFRASVTIPGGGSATGWGSETARDFGDFLEKAETKALGRALAALGYGTQFAPELDEGDRIADSPVDRKPTPRAGTTPGREPAPRRSPQRPTPSDRPAAVPSAAGPPSPGKATAEELEELSAADFGWTEFWSWARQRGYSDRTSLDAAVGRSTQGMTPVEIRAALRKVVVPA